MEIVNIPVTIEENIIIVEPEHRSDLSKTLNIFVNPPCDSGYTYFEMEDIPNSTVVLDGSQCFNDIDLSTLNDIINTNNLDITSPLEIGTQNWFNGKVTRLLIGNYYDGGNITLTSLPESIGNAENTESPLGEGAGPTHGIFHPSINWIICLLIDFSVLIADSHPNSQEILMGCNGLR